MSEIQATRRKSQEESFSRLSDCLRALNDDQLEEVRRRFSHIEGLSDATDMSALMAAWKHPVAKAHSALYDLMVEEANHRTATMLDIEADLNGGHLVEVGTGDRNGTFAAYCLPERHVACWEGPDRATVAEALEDGRRHHPGCEPRLWSTLAGGEGLG